MVLLQPMPEHRTVDFIKQAMVNLDDAVGADSKNVLVVSSMMNLAQCQAIWHHRQAQRIVVRNDVSCIEQFAVM